MYGNRCNISDLLLVLNLKHQTSRVSKWTRGRGCARQTSTQRQDFAAVHRRDESARVSRTGPADRRIRLCGPDFGTLRTAVMKEMAPFSHENDQGGVTERAGERVVHGPSADRQVLVHWPLAYVWGEAVEGGELGAADTSRRKGGPG